MFYDELFSRANCTICQQEIQGLGVGCVDCPANLNVRLCLFCFRDGGEQGPHKADHGYRFFDSGTIRIYPPVETKDEEGNTVSTCWTAKEDIRLLDAIEQYGFGNWQDISRHIETKSSTEAKQKFVDRFIFGAMGQLTWQNNLTTKGGEMKSAFHIVDHTVPSDNSPLSPSLSIRQPPLDIGLEEILQLGYMPQRDDYEKEYDNEAEKLLSQISFSAEDEEIDVALKLSLVDMYSQRLHERFRRKRVIKEYQLVSQFFKKDRLKANSSSVTETPVVGKPVVKKRFAAYEKYLHEKLRPFAQFRTGKEHEHLINNLVKEKELILRLEELYKYRSNGITRHEECVEFEKFKNNGINGSFGRGKRLQSEMLGTLDEADDETDCGGVGDRSYNQSRKKVALEKNSPLMPAEELKNESQDLRKLSSPGPLQGSMVVEGEGSAVNDVENVVPSSVKSLTQRPFSKEDINSSSCMGFEGSALVSSPQGKKELLNPLVLSPAQQNVSSPQIETPKGLVALSTADVFIPSQDMLSSNEMNLCTKINMLPAQYLTVKAALIVNNPSLAMNPGSEYDPTLQPPCPTCIEKREWDEIRTFMLDSNML